MKRIALAVSVLSLMAFSAVSASSEQYKIQTKGKGYATGQLGKKHLNNRNDGINYFGFNETPPPGYFGNWGYNPGGEYWNPNYLWRRSLGFWDTNAPGCPFRSC